jgi:probable phosphoglycerate mutase
MRSKETETRVIFVRHGHTDFPDDRVYCDGIENPTLSADGQRQVQAAAQYFQGMAIDALYASPVLRTWQTAQAIAKVAGLDPIEAPAMIERRFGLWEGLYFHEIEQRFPAEYLQWKNDKVGYTPQGGETVPQLLARVSGGLDEIVRRHRGQTVILVSHVGPIRVAITDAFRMPLELYRQIRIDYASISRIDYGQTLNNFIFLNRVRYP